MKICNSFCVFSRKNAVMAQFHRKYTSLNVSATSSEESVEERSIAPLHERKMAKPSLTKALFKAFGKVLFVAGFFKFCQDVLSFVSPQLLK